MASLLNQTPSQSYKDLLTVASDTPNQGLETTVKQVRDGEGIGSPLYLNTAWVQVGTDSANSTLVIKGNLSVSGEVKFAGTGDASIKKGNEALITAKSTGIVQFKNITSANEPVPSTGDLAVIEGSFYLGV